MDQPLVDKIKAGDYQAFEALVSRYEGKVYRLAMRMLRNQEDAEDALQETFLQVYRGLNGFEGRSTFSTWLFRLATNVCLMKIRHREPNRHIYYPWKNICRDMKKGNIPKFKSGPISPKRFS